MKRERANTKGTVWIGNDGFYIDGVKISEPLTLPDIDFSAVRITWDEETQSVKYEEVPLTDIYNEPSRESGK